MEEVKKPKHYAIKKDGVVLSKFNNLYDAIMCQLKEIKETTKKYYGAFGDSPMPLTFEACLIFDEEIEKNLECRIKAYKVLDLFRTVVYPGTHENFFNSIADILDKSFDFEIGDLKINVIQDEELVTVELDDGRDYVKTNIFSSLGYTGKRYFYFSSNNDNIKNNPNIKFGDVYKCSIDLEEC